jgi:hypothetical protein
MSRGVGELQRRILAELARPHEPAYRFAVNVANELFPPLASRSVLVSVRRALASLAERRLVWTRFDAALAERGISCGLPWTRMLPGHDAQPAIGDPCRCCPGGQDAFRATLDHAGARRLLGLAPEPTPAPVPTGYLPPAGMQRTKIPIDALGIDLIVAMKKASRATGLDAPRGSPCEYAFGFNAIKDGWIPRQWATDHIREVVARLYDIDDRSSHGRQVASKVLRHLETRGQIEIGTIERDAANPGMMRPYVFVRLVDK